VPDNSGIRSKNPKEENINAKKRTYKKKTMWRNNIIQTSSSEDQIGKKESNNQNSHIHHHDDPTGKITKIMNIKSQISSRKIF
jgi:hypothetical protein